MKIEMMFPNGSVLVWTSIGDVEEHTATGNLYFSWTDEEGKSHKLYPGANAIEIIKG